MKLERETGSEAPSTNCPVQFIYRLTRAIRDPWRHRLTIRRVCPAEQSAVVKGVHTRPTRLTARLPSIAVLLALVLLSSCNGSTGAMDRARVQPLQELPITAADS